MCLLSQLARERETEKYVNDLYLFMYINQPVYVYSCMLMIYIHIYMIICRSKFMNHIFIKY